MLHRTLRHVPIRITVAAGALLLCAASTQARVTRLTIDKRESPAYKAQAFGKAGQYELLCGHFTGELDPDDPHNAIITDIKLAPRNARGMVEYTATFAIAKPIDMTKASSVLIYSVPNRGRGAPVATPDGHVSVVSGWQGDVAPRRSPDHHRAHREECRWLPRHRPRHRALHQLPRGANTLALTAAVSALAYQRPLTLDTAKASLSSRASDTGPATRSPPPTGPSPIAAPPPSPALPIPPASARKAASIPPAV